MSSSCGNGETTFLAIPAEIIESHILTKLDGQTLASMACVSTKLYALCINENLWKNICYTLWPSIIKHPLVHNAISTFPFGYRSFFVNSFPPLESRGCYSDEYHHHHPPPAAEEEAAAAAATTHLISAVEIKYKETVLFSKVSITSTLTEDFLYWPLCIELLSIKDKGVKFTVEEDELLPHIAEQLKVSWIMIDPTSKRLINLSSIRPVLIEPVYHVGFKRMCYSSLMMLGSSKECWEFEISIIYDCEGMKRGEMKVKEVTLQVKKMADESNLTGKDGLIILQKAMDLGVCDLKARNKKGDIYEEYLKIRRIREETKAKEKVAMLSVGDYAYLSALSISLTGFLLCLYLWRCIRRTR